MRILSGKALKEPLLNELKEKVKGKHIPFFLYSRKDDLPSFYYLKGIKKTLNLLSIPYEEMFYDESLTLEENLSLFRKHSFNQYTILARPLKVEGEERFIESINPLFDPDMVSAENGGKLFHGDLHYLPATVFSVKHILDSYSIALDGKKALVVGRSLTIGKPLSLLALSENATVTIAHSHTPSDVLNSIAKNQDVIFLASGKPGLIHRESFSSSSIVIDCGFSKNGGDLGFIPEESELNAYTPVPGGVGALTSLSLVENALYLNSIQKK